MLSEVRFDHMRLLRSEAQNWGGRRGHPKMIWHPPWQTRRPPKLLGGIFEKKSGGQGPPTPPKLALRAPLNISYFAPLIMLAMYCTKSGNKYTEFSICIKIMDIY